MMNATATAKANELYLTYAQHFNCRVRETLQREGVTMRRNLMSGTVLFDAEEYFRYTFNGRSDRRVAQLLANLRQQADAETQQRVIAAFPYAVALIAAV